MHDWWGAKRTQTSRRMRVNGSVKEKQPEENLRLKLFIEESDSNGTWANVGTDGAADGCDG